ncbi:MAG: ACP S-malonyltransferase [Bacteroidales bacterium]|nr:ACP S-malonyltransferase [Bacteroidales bacterium]
MKAFIFPGQGSQFSGMGKDLYDTKPIARELFDRADTVLGYRITEVMFEGSATDLVATKITQPAVFLHSFISAKCLENFSPDMVAGHSLGEFSALAAAEAISFEDALRLVYARAMAMQEACDANPGGMAAVIGLEDSIVEEVCHNTEGVVVPANYNCPGQLVISGEKDAVARACDAAVKAGARGAIPLNVGGAFHSPLMSSAAKDLAKAIDKVPFHTPVCPVYQNVDALPHSSKDEIKQNLLLQLNSPVKWSASVLNMIADGATVFTELGPGKVLRGLVKKISSSAVIE